MVTSAATCQILPVLSSAPSGAAHAAAAVLWLYYIECLATSTVNFFDSESDVFNAGSEAQVL